jgi:hypothetical protein
VVAEGGQSPCTPEIGLGRQLHSDKQLEHEERRIRPSLSIAVVRNGSHQDEQEAMVASGRRRVRRAQIALLLLGAMVLPLVNAQAIAAPSRPTARTLSELIQQDSERTGRSWGVIHLTKEELKRLEANEADAQARASRTSSPAVVPRDASGCSSDVCIVLKSQGGSGPVITFWETSAKQYSYDGRICGPRASFRVNGAISFLGDIPDSVCATVPPGGVSLWYIRRTDLPRRFAVGASLCNAWSPRNFVGYPCKRVGA